MVELVLFNCPAMKIGVSSISVTIGPQLEQVDASNVSTIPISCDHLVHVCLDVFTVSPLVSVVFRGDQSVEWLHVAEVIFFGIDEDIASWSCPTDLMVPEQCEYVLTVMVDLILQPSSLGGWSYNEYPPASLRSENAQSFSAHFL